MTDPHTIARGLTDAQRKAVLWCLPSGEARVWQKGDPREVSFWTLKEVIKGDPNKKISMIYRLTIYHDHPTIRDGWRQATCWALTPLGLEVRRVLEEEAGHP